MTGIYVNAFDPNLNISEGFPVFNTVIEANCVTKKNDNLSAFNITGACCCGCGVCVCVATGATH